MGGTSGVPQYCRCSWYIQQNSQWFVVEQNPQANILHDPNCDWEFQGLWKPLHPASGKSQTGIFWKGVLERAQEAPEIVLQIMCPQAAIKVYGDCRRQDMEHSVRRDTRTSVSCVVMAKSLQWCRTSILAGSLTCWEVQQPCAPSEDLETCSGWDMLPISWGKNLGCSHVASCRAWGPVDDGEIFCLEGRVPRRWQSQGLLGSFLWASVLGSPGNRGSLLGWHHLPASLFYRPTATSTLDVASSQVTCFDLGFCRSIHT